MNGVFLIIILVGIWFLLDKMTLISSQVANSVNATQRVQEATQSILTSLDNICGGSGIKTVPS